MVKYKKVYLKFWNIGEQDIVMCDCCKHNIATDIHHIEFRSQGGQDWITNLIALCRECHSWAHNSYKKISATKLQNIINKKIDVRNSTTKNNT